MQSYPQILSDRVMLRPPQKDPGKQGLALAIIPVGEFDEVGLAELRQDGNIVSTACYIKPERRGQGLGKATREALLSFAFLYLGAELAISKAEKDNHQSNAISERLGYQRDRELDQVEPEKNHWMLRKENFQPRDISVIGLSPYLKTL